MISKRRKWVCTGIIAVITIGLVSGLFANYLYIDFSRIRDALPEVLASGLDIISDTLGCRRGTVAFTGARLTREVINQTIKGREEEILICFWIMVIVPYILSLVAAGLSFVRRFWGYLAGVICSALGLLLCFFMTFVYLPDRLFRMVPQEILDGTDKLGEAAGFLDRLGKITGYEKISDAAKTISDVTTGISPKLFRDLIQKGLGTGWYILAIGLIVLGIACSAGFTVCVLTDRRHPFYRDKEQYIWG